MTSNNTKTHGWIYLPLLLCSSTAIAAGQSASAPQPKDEFREINNANYNYVGGKTRVGVGVDTEFDGTADISHIFSETNDTATSGDAWVGFNFSGEDKGVNAGGVRLNHHWVSRDKQGRPLRVNKVFGAYDRNTYGDDRATLGYGQEIDKGFWEGYVGKGLSGKRAVGRTNDGRELSEKGYKYNVGGQVGTFLPDSNIRLRGGLDYAWDSERGINEDKPEQLTLSAGIEKFFQDTPHSVSLDVATSRNDGGFGSNSTDTRANLSYRYDFGGTNIYQSDKQLKRVRVEIPGHAHPAKTVRKAIKTPYRQAYKKAVKVRACELVKSTVELGSDTFFKPNSSRLLPSAQKRLNQVIAQIRRTGYNGNIRITGNTCDIGSLKHNQILSERRASAVKRYFAAHGFDRSELLARGLGETSPKYPNTKGNRHKNRRVDIEYVTQDAACKDGYKTIQKTAYRTAYKTEYKNIVVKQAGISKPSVTWKTEVVEAEPAWIKRALHNSVRHNRRISTYRTTAGSANLAGTPIILANDTATTLENTPVTINVLANDTGNGLTVTNVTQPANGSVTIANNSIVFTPNQGFTGTDSFIYTVTDSNGNSSQATVTITVTPQVTVNNVAPVAQDDTATTTSLTNAVGQPVTIDVLANDSDADGDSLTITSITPPSNGTASIVNGQVIYTPATGFVGTDTFTYTISDGNGHTTTATVSVVVSAATGNNTAPVAQDDNATSNGSAVTINVTNNDTDPDQDTLTLVSVTQPSNGSAIINNGQVVFTPNPGFVGTDTFTYTISDGNGHTATANVSVIVVSTGVGNTNIAPVAQNDTTTVVNAPAVNVTINVLANDTDADGDTLTLVSITQPNNGSANITNGQVVYTPNAGFTGTDTLTYTISDGNGHTTTATVTIIVTGRNIAPVAQDDTATSDGNPISINVLNNDNDADNDLLIITNISQPVNGTATISNGEVLYTPNQGYTGSDSFTYTISDGNGHTTTANVTVDVTAVRANVAPVAQDDSAISNGSTVNINVLTNDSDADNDVLTLSNVSQPQNGTSSISGGQVTYTPNNNFSGTDSFTYTIRDTNGNTATATVNVVVNSLTASSNNNVAPIAQADSGSTTGGAITINVLGNDTDPDGDTITIINNTQPGHGQASIVNGQILYTPTQGFTGIDTFTYTISDGKNHSSDAIVSINVQGAQNQAPIVNDDFLGIVNANQTLSIRPLANDSDPDGDTLQIVSVGSTPNGTSVIQGEGVIQFTPVKDYCGNIQFDYTVTDGNGNSRTATIHLQTEFL